MSTLSRGGPARAPRVVPQKPEIKVSNAAVCDLLNALGYPSPRTVASWTVKSMNGARVIFKVNLGE